MIDNIIFIIKHNIIEHMPISTAQAIHESTTVASRVDALDIFDGYNQWSIGLEYAIPYIDEVGDLCIIVAIGIKDSNVADPDNYRVIIDTSIDGGGGGGVANLHTTMMVINGTEVPVTNEQQHDYITNDMFTFDEITYE